MTETTITHAIGLESVVGEAVRGDGFVSHAVESPFQSGPTSIHVMRPDDPLAETPVLYVLPVAPHGVNPWGDPVAECVAHDVANRHGLTCVVPTFSTMPWYADHPTDRRMQQETYFLDVVVPFVERRYPVRSAADGRRLLGFSKSGWGAFSLLLRHPDLFGRAAAWDAPLGQQSPTKYGMSEVFPTQAALDPFCVFDLLRERAAELAGPPRLGLFGYGSFRAHHQAAHHYMLRLGIDHRYADGPRREHEWHSGWLPELVEFLCSDGARSQPSDPS